MSITFRRVLTMALVAGALSAARPASAQTLQHVRDLYAQAAYEDALGALARLPESEPPTEAGRYRAACLLALGRVDEAQRTIAAVVEAHPTYTPDPSDTSPRVLELFRAARARALPGVVRRLYGEAKAAIDRKALPEALDTLESMLALAGDPDLADDATVAELKQLASGFRDLTKAQLAAAAPPAVSPLPAAPAVDPGAPVVAAVPVRQPLPAWVPPAGASQRTDYSGAISVRIGVDGRVTSAVMIEPVHPAYDALLLAAARGWVYEPATQNGTPVVSERTVQITLKPR